MDRICPTMDIEVTSSFKKILEKQGFKILHIPYFEWELLAGDAKRAEYLRHLLAVDH